MRLFRSVALTTTITVCGASVAVAQERQTAAPTTNKLILPAAALAGAAVFDITSTQRAFARGCVEGNTVFYGSHPSMSRLLMVKASTTGFGVVAMLIAHKTRHYKLAQWFGYGAGGATAAIGVLNTANACK